MKRKMLFSLILSILVCFSAFAQFDEVDHDRRYAIFGGQFYNDKYAGSGTVIIPEKFGAFEGWLAGHLNKVDKDWLIVGRAEGGVEVGADWTINLFGEWRKDQFAGVENQLQVGIFGESPRVEIGNALFTFGIGNFVEGEQAQEDLGLKDTDERLVRALAYGSLNYQAFNLLVKSTPNAHFWGDKSDMQFVVQNTLRLSKDLSLMALFEYDSHPVVVDQFWQISGGVQLEKNF